MYSLYRLLARSPWIAVLALALTCFGLSSFCSEIDTTGSEFRAAVATGDVAKVQVLLASHPNLISSRDNQLSKPARSSRKKC